MYDLAHQFGVPNSEVPGSFPGRVNVEKVTFLYILGSVVRMIVVPSAVSNFHNTSARIVTIVQSKYTLELQQRMHSCPIFIYYHIYLFTSSYVIYVYFYRLFMNVH